MTFFNVVSAVLFLGAIQQLIFALDAGQLTHIMMSATLMVLVFNDAVYTSHVVEGVKSVDYRLNLMLVDLFNFLLLACAILTINPSRGVFDVVLINIGPHVREWHFWAIVSVYWLGVMLWSYLGGVYAKHYPRGLLLSSFAVTGVFALQAGVASRSPQSASGSVAAFLWLLIHITVMRPLMYRIIRSAKSKPRKSKNR